MHTRKEESTVIKYFQFREDDSSEEFVQLLTKKKII